MRDSIVDGDTGGLIRVKHSRRVAESPDLDEVGPGRSKGNRRKKTPEIPDSYVLVEDVPKIVVSGEVESSDASLEMPISDDVDKIVSALDKKARFVASEIEVARLNGSMNEEDRRSLEERLRVSRAYMAGSLKDCYERHEFDEEKLKEKLVASWDEIRSYMQEVAASKKASEVPVKDASVVPEIQESISEKPDLEMVKDFVDEEAEKYMSGIFARIKKAEDSKDRKSLAELRNGSWLVFDRAHFNFPFQLGEDQEQEVRNLLKRIGGEKKDLVQSEVNAAYRRMILTEETTSGFYNDLERISDLGTIDGKNGDGNAWRSRFTDIAKSALGMNEEEFNRRDWEQPVPEFLRDKFFELLKERRSSKQDDPVVVQESEAVVGSVPRKEEASPVTDLRDVETFDQFYFAVRQMEDLHEDGRPDNVLSGDGWEKLLHTMESNARRMDDEEYLNGHWRAGIPEILRSKFIELLDADRDYGKNPVGGRDRVMDDAMDRLVKNEDADAIQSRRIGEKGASVKLAESVELREKIVSLKAEISEKELRQIELETKRNKQREESVRLSLLRAEYEKRFRNVFLKPFTNEDRLGHFSKEEGRAKQRLEEMDAEWAQKKEELNYLHAELREAIHDLEQLTDGSGSLEAFDKESAAKAFGRSVESVGEVADGDGGESEERFDPIIEAVANGASTEGLPEIHVGDAPKDVFVEINPQRGGAGKDASVMMPEQAVEEDAVSRREGEGGVVIAEESAPESAESEDPKKEGKIYEGVASRFVGEFAIERSDLDRVEGFRQLSEGQQLLVLENLKQLTLGRIVEEAEKVTESDRQKSGFFGRVWKSVSKKYQIAKAEKTKAEEILHGGVSMHGKILEQLVAGMRDMGPEVEVGKDRETIEMKFSRVAGKLSEDDRLVADDFDRVANEFARMPYEWSLSTATDDERKRYADTQDVYKESLRLMQGVIYRSESLPDAHLILNDMDGKVRMMQFLQTHPELEERLNDLREQSAWRAMLNTVVTERGAYFAYGYAGRTLLAGTLGWAAAPVVAAGAGGFMSWNRAKETLQSSDVAARRGTKDNGAEAKNVVTIKGLSDKLERLIQKIEGASGEKGQANAALLLKTRMEYTRRKVEEGLVDFGEKPETRVLEQYDLLQLLARAEAIVGVYSGENEVLNERLGRFLDFKEQKISAARKKYIRNQVLKGVAISGGFALAGAAARYLSEVVDDRLAVPEGSKETIKEVLDVSERTPDGSEAAGESSMYPNSNAESMDAVSAPAPESAVPDKSPLSEEDWRADSGEGGLMKASYQVREDSLSGFREQVSPRLTESMPVESGSGVGADNLHGRMDPGVLPDQRAAVLNTDQPLADQSELSQETRDEIARQDAEALAELQDESSPASDEEAIPSSSAVSEAWNESVEKARLGTENDLTRLGEDIPREISLDSRGVGVDARDDAVVGGIEEGNMGSEAEAVSTVTVPEVEPNLSSVAEKVDVNLDIVHEVEQARTAGDVDQGYLNERVGSGFDDMEASITQPSGPAVSETDIKVVYSLVESDEVREYLMTHPENIETFRRSLADYDASIFESAHGDTGMRGVANMSELNDDLKAKQVMYDCLKLIRDPLTPTYEVKTYQLKNSLNFDQMQNVGEFMMKASERFGRGAFPMGSESLRGYLERMTALFAERGETVKLNGDTRLLKQLAFQGFKR